MIENMVARDGIEPPTPAFSGLTEVKYFYGDANKYSAIVSANGIDDPNKIKVGQKLVIPA